MHKKTFANLKRFPNPWTVPCFATNKSVNGYEICWVSENLIKSHISFITSDIWWRDTENEHPWMNAETNYNAGLAHMNAEVTVVISAFMKYNFCVYFNYLPHHCQKNAGSRVNRRLFILNTHEWELGKDPVSPVLLTHRHLLDIDLGVTIATIQTHRYMFSRYKGLFVSGFLPPSHYWVKFLFVVLPALTVDVKKKFKATFLPRNSVLGTLLRPCCEQFSFRLLFF